MRNNILRIILEDETSINLFIDRLVIVEHDFTLLKLSIVKFNETMLVIVIIRNTNMTTYEMDLKVLGVA